ncbi:asparagine synthase (glutamine-hydrolyzing) [Catenovulum agarivorans]|uniref:asparagine synthase (glutamine-hydrolyzing) n=1 Tax=Catenovulum agarivorans TaxID=1172192 RepID=UPI0002F4E4B6|nr:asparagine synthase (glutamine-hydrolyzing) [Catenovulum agarivorans]
MCGIAGFSRFNFSGDTELLVQMGNTIAHRGPDAHGEYVTDTVGLCHRRLSIIDLSEAGKQPMHSADGQISIVFNGEIYNYQAVRAELINKGHEFANQTDTAVIIAAYKEYGEDCLAHLNGMFAFAIWDEAQQKLFIARDRLGKKPLYYYFDGTDIFFASELKALKQISQIPTEIRTDAVYDFFAYQYIPDPKTIYKNIYKLEPGHCISFQQGKLDKRQYWDVSFANTDNADIKQHEQALIKTVTDCTKTRMVADVPLGAFLSGGVDSSGIVALMSSVAKEQDGDKAKPVTTCSIGFDVKAFNETEFAQVVADKYQTDHHEFIVHQNVKDNLAKIVRYFDEPFADPSLVPTYFVSELARQQVTVAVAGDGGDEIFAGYEKYAVDAQENKIRDAFPSWFNKKIAPSLAKVISVTPLLNTSTVGRKACSLLNTLAVDPAMGFYYSNAFITDKTWLSLVNEQTSAELAGYHPSKITLDKYSQADGPDHLAKVLYTDLKTFLPGGILVKADRMSMANSLEVRAPLLDYTVVEQAAKIPSEYKFNQGDKKHILKNIFKPLLPDEILYRKKMGFSVPLADWFRGEIKHIAEDKLLTNNAGLVKYFKADAIKKLWDEHQAAKHDHGAVLWSLLMFQMWWDEYVTAE